MSALRLIDVLPDFGAPPPDSASASASVPPSRRDIERPVAPPPQVDVEAAVRARVAVAEEALRLTLGQEHEAALASERARAAAALEAQARLLGAEAGAAIGARLDEMERQIQAAVSSAVARILGGLLSDDLLRRSLESLVVAIRAAIAADDAVRIEVRGPASIAEPLMQALGERAAAIHFVETEGLDVSAAIDDGTIETRMSEWADTLSGILA
jgi:hypothetical protein